MAVIGTRRFGIVSARSFSSTLAAFLLALAFLGGAPNMPAQAAGQQWAARMAPLQPVFRHARQGIDSPRSTAFPSRIRAVPVAAGNGAPRYQPLRRSPSLSSAYRAGARKAVPVTRGQELGLRFRPDERDPAYGPSAPAQGGPASAGNADPQELHSQFRPVQPRRKPTYEELHQQTPPMAPDMGYPMMTFPPMPGGGGYWPTW